MVLLFLGYVEEMDRPRQRDPEIAEVVECLETMRSRRIPIEVNLRSNEVLVIGMYNNMTALDKFMNQLNLSVILCTDDEGIWSISHSGYQSVAGEFARAFQEGSVDSVKARLMIDDTIKTKFDQDRRTRL